MSGSLSGWIIRGRRADDARGHRLSRSQLGILGRRVVALGAGAARRSSFVYGRVFPPADAADATRIPGFLIALGPDGPTGYSTRVRIDETDDPATGHPRQIIVRGRGDSLDLQMTIQVEDAIVNRGGALAAGPDFLQLRGRYRVTGSAGGQHSRLRSARRGRDIQGPTGRSQSVSGGRPDRGSAAPMVRRLLVREGEREHAPIVPEPSQERNPERIAAAEHAGRHGDLGQAGHRALFTRPGFLAVPDESSFVRRWPRLVRRVEEGVESLAIHQR